MHDLYITKTGNIEYFFFMVKAQALQEISLRHSKSGACAKIAIHVALEFLKVVFVGKHDLREIVPEWWGSPDNGIFERCCLRSTKLDHVRMGCSGSTSTSPIHSSRWNRAGYVSRTFTMKVSVEKSQITNPPSMFQIFKVIGQFRVTDQTNSSLLDRIQ